MSEKFKDMYLRMMIHKNVPVSIFLREPRVKQYQTYSPNCVNSMCGVERAWDLCLGRETHMDSVFIKNL